MGTGGGEGAPIVLYHAPDKCARQRRVDYSWRRFKEIIKQNSVSQYDMQYDLRFDPRDRIVASSWR